MPSTYTPSGVELIGDGEQSGTWGAATNNNLQLLDSLASRAIVIPLSGTTGTVSVSDGYNIADPAAGHHAVLVFSGSPSGTATVTITPADAERVFFVTNTTVETVTLTQGAGGNVDVPAGQTAIVYCADGVVTSLSAGLATETLTAIGALTPADGNVIVGNGSTWVAESGNTVLASLGVTATAAELNLLDGVTWTLTDYNTLTSTAAELNLLDGVTWTLADYNTLTSTAAELNVVDGDTAATATTLVDTDRVVTNDNGTMVQVAMTDVSTYMFSSLSIDEDDMASDSATKLPTQQSTKAYVDSKAGMVHIVTKTASASATLDFTEFDASIYSQYVFTIHSLKPTSDGQDIRVVLSTDGGSTFVTTNDYDWGIAGNTVNAGTFDERDTSTSYIRIARDVDSDATRMGLCATLNLYDPSLAGDTVLGGTGMWHRNDNSRYNAVMHGFLNGSSAVDAIRFFAESGTLASGTITMYGLLK